MLAVNNNPTAFSVFTNFTSNLQGMKKAMGNLSTGVKSVADDASGVAISERLRAQASSTAASRSNVDNAISMTQTADSWLQKVNDALSRMSELAISAGDGAKSATDKANIEVEFSALQDEVSRITSKSTAAAKFNGLYLFRGGNGVAVQSGDGVGSGNISVQIGADNGQTLNISLNDLQETNTEVIGTVTTYAYNSSNAVTASTRTTVGWASVVDSTKLSVTSSNAVGKLAVAIDHIADARASVGAQQSRLDQTRSGLLNYEDNIRAAESKIRDIDFARESADFAKFQILGQISNAMLAQANQIPGQALQLIG